MSWSDRDTWIFPTPKVCASPETWTSCYATPVCVLVFWGKDQAGCSTQARRIAYIRSLVRVQYAREFSISIIALLMKSLYCDPSTQMMKGLACWHNLNPHVLCCGLWRGAVWMKWPQFSSSGHWNQSDLRVVRVVIRSRMPHGGDTLHQSLAPIGAAEDRAIDQTRIHPVRLQCCIMSCNDFLLQKLPTVTARERELSWS